MSDIAERQIVAARREGPHDHITKVRLADGSEQDAADVIAAIEAHEAHYFMRRSTSAMVLGKVLVRSQQCPDCREVVLWA